MAGGRFSGWDVRVTDEAGQTIGATSEIDLAPGDSVRVDCQDPNIKVEILRIYDEDSAGRKVYPPRNYRPGADVSAEHERKRMIVTWSGVEPGATPHAEAVELQRDPNDSHDSPAHNYFFGIRFRCMRPTGGIAWPEWDPDIHDKPRR
jgi:hypothetical protein